MTEQDTPKMTHDEMIDALKGLVFGTFDRTTAKEREALDMAISALSENKGDLISRQAVLDELKKLDWQDLYLPSHFEQILDDVPSVENKGEWIPVSERLPLLSGGYKVSDDVLITNGYEIDMGYRVERKGKAFWHYYGSDNEVFINGEDDDVIAWQPLPEPYYKAESEDKHGRC